jgi:2-iminobutanoate/2-iminopropanoate deaminase
MQPIATAAAPKAIGPYSQAILQNGMLFVSGQLGLNPATGEFAPTFEAQTEQVFANIEAILKQAGMGFQNVVKVSVFLQDLSQFAAMNAIYARFFKEPYPAREAVQVARLPKDGLIEISVIAMK